MIAAVADKKLPSDAVEPEGMSVDTAHPEPATSADESHEAFLATSKRAGRRNAIPVSQSSSISQLAVTKNFERYYDILLSNVSRDTFVSLN